MKHRNDILWARLFWMGLLLLIWLVCFAVGGGPAFTEMHYTAADGYTAAVGEA